MRDINDPLIAAIRLLGSALWTFVMAVPQSLLIGFGRVAASRRVARLYWRGIAWILGLVLVTRGDRSARHPTLFVSNHVSYLDVIVLGALLEAAFVAKAEVRGWPAIGLIAKLGRTVFVDRRPRKSLEHRDEMLDRLAKAGESLILFPEGTSHDGNRILPFKSALFSAAEVKDAQGRHIAVQPVSLAYTRLDGMPIGRLWRPFYAWYGRMALIGHFWRAVGLGLTTVEVEFHPPVSLDQFASRKALADHCHALVGRGLVLANSGRQPAAPGAAATPQTA